MRNRSALTITALMLSTGLSAAAGAYTDCAAQNAAVPGTERLSLNAAIEEAKRSPFHAGARGQTNALRSIEMGIGGAGWYHRQESGLQEEASLPGPPFVLTLVFAEASHFAAVYLLLVCIDDTHYGCVLGPALTVPAVALPAGLSGVPVAKALVASTIGLAGGIGAFVATMLVTEGISNANPLASALVSGLVHAGISTALFRRLR